MFVDTNSVIHINFNVDFCLITNCIYIYNNLIYSLMIESNSWDLSTERIVKKSTSTT